jgi:hypothetical protein
MNQRDEKAHPLGRTRLLPGYLEIALIVILCIGSVNVAQLLLSSQIAPLFTHLNYNLDNNVTLDNIHVSVQTPPEVYVNHPFTVTASISASQPLTALSGSGENVLNGPPGGTGGSLADILRPPASFTGSYALCLIVDLHFDDDSAFDFSKYPTPYTTEQEFTLVPDVTRAETIEWTVTPRETFGFETVQEARVRVWFDAETTCRLGTPSLLGEMFYLFSSPQNPLPPSTKVTVVNEDLQTLAVAAVAGFFAWLLWPPRARRRQGASKTDIQRRAAKRLWLIVVVPRAALLCMGMLFITLSTSPAVYSLGPVAALAFFYGGMVMALVGSVLLAREVRRLRFASSP